MILNDFPFNFGQCRIKQVIELFHSYQTGCAFCGDIVQSTLINQLYGVSISVKLGLFQQSCQKLIVCCPQLTPNS